MVVMEAGRTDNQARKETAMEPVWLINGTAIEEHRPGMPTVLVCSVDPSDDGWRDRLTKIIDADRELAKTKAILEKTQRIGGNVTKRLMALRARDFQAALSVVLDAAQNEAANCAATGRELGEPDGTEALKNALHIRSAVDLVRKTLDGV